MLNNKEKLMMLAIENAMSSYTNNEVPVGAVIYEGEKVIAEGQNAMTSKGPTRHAEIEAIEKAFLVSKDFSNFEIYVTLEPCVMCYWAIRKSGIKKIYFSTYNNKEGFSNYFDNTDVFYTSGILEKESRKLLSDFFKDRR